MSISSDSSSLKAQNGKVEIFDDAMSIASEGNFVRDLMPIEPREVQEDFEIFGLPKCTSDHDSNHHLKMVTAERN